MKNSLLVLFALFITSNIFSQVGITAGPYLQSPTQTGIKIKWRTTAPTTAKVMYGTSPSTLTQTATEATVTDKHTVTITGLTPYTQYYYAIYNDNTFAEGGDMEHAFRTFPVSTDPGHVRAWAIGDFGKGNSKEAAVRDSYPFDSLEANVWLWLGDNVYDNGTEAQYLAKVFDSVWGYRNLMRHLPYMPAPGNHDYESVSPIAGTIDPASPSHTGPYYDFVDVYTNGEAGGVASNRELYYSYDYRNVHFVSLNSELGSMTNSSHNWTGAWIPLLGSNNFTSSPMSQWLHQDLAANTKPWVVVYFHQPPYSDGSHNSGDIYEAYMRGMRANFNPIFEQYGVDIVLCGHSHAFERSYLVKGAYGEDNTINTGTMIIQNRSGNDVQGQAYTKTLVGPDPNKGTVYVVCGNSGSSESSPGFSHPFMYSEYGCDTCIGSFVLDVEGGRLDGRHIDAYGNIRDHFTIHKTLVSGVEPAWDNIVVDLKVVPNPFSSITTVSFELMKSEKTNIRLMDVTGKLIEVFEGNLQQGKQQIEIDAQKLKLAKGAYTLVMSAGGESTSRTIILQ
ncbi:MAG: metallophosphoesterase [Bacteroidota bacterium]